MGNTLTVWFGDPQAEYICQETGDEVILMKDKSGRVWIRKAEFLRGRVGAMAGCFRDRDGLKTKLDLQVAEADLVIEAFRGVCLVMEVSMVMTKELIHKEIDHIGEESLDELYDVIRPFTRSGPHVSKPSLMARLRSIRIDAPRDFAANLDLYTSGEKG